MIKHILYIQPIFIPDETRFEQNKLSIESFLNYLKTYPPSNIKLSITFGGWKTSDVLWNKISKVIKSSFSDCELVEFDKNYGKAYIVNKLYENTRFENIDAILTADSDIIFTTRTKYMFERLSKVATEVEKKKNIPWGIIALNQKEECCHLPLSYQNLISFETKINKFLFLEKIVWSDSSQGIAGGCLFINTKFWEQIKGYRVMGVYAGDDGYLFIDCKKTGYSWQLADSISIIHPYPEQRNNSYVGWKIEMLKQNIEGKELDITEKIKESEEFWRKING